jgi:Alpha amylase, C-terminal all-beta domain
VDRRRRRENSVYAFLRKGTGANAAAPVLAVFNATPIPRFNYRVGVPRDGIWVEVLNTDGAAFGGGNHGNVGGVEASPVPAHGRPFSLNLTLPPLGALYLKPVLRLGDGGPAALTTPAPADRAIQVAVRLRERVALRKSTSAWSLGATWVRLG